jgi:hypothetical protein
LSQEATASLKDGARGRRTDRSAHLGSTLRAVMLQPRDGFAQVLAVTEQRRDRGYRTPEGAAPSVFAALGGAALMSVWLKLGGLLEVRAFASADFRWAYLFATLLIGAVVGVLAQLMWSVLAGLVARRFGRRVDQAELRTVWGAASFPLAFALFPLLVLDVAIVGPASFTTERLTDPLSTTWAAISIAMGAALVIWWMYLLTRGFAATTGFKFLRSLPSLLVALLSALGLMMAVRGMGLLLGAGL